MTMPSSFNVSGLLGGVAGQIDTDSLVQQLMQLQSLPQRMLKDQLSVQQTTLSAFQALNTRFTALQTAIQNLTDVDAWQVTTATSSNTAVVATSSTGAATGATTFNVTALAKAQVSTVAADAGGNVVSDPSQPLLLTVGGVEHSIDLSGGSGSAADVAAAINQSDLGVRASVVNTDGGTVLQLTSAKTGTDTAFSSATFGSSLNTVVGAANAQISVGTVGSGGYTITSQSNTFTDAIPGVTFSVNAVVNDVTISVATDAKAIADKVQALVTAANDAYTTLGQTSAKGAVLETNFDIKMLAQSVLNTVSKGTNSGGSLKEFGIDLDKDGKISFDAAAFTGAFTKDAAKAKDAIAGSLGTALKAVVDSAIDPTAGNVSAGIKSATDQSKELNDRINDWSGRLVDIEMRMKQKYAAMNAALATLQSQSTYLTNMLKSMNTKSDN